MSKYICKIIEVLRDNGQWEAVGVPLDDYLKGIYSGNVLFCLTDSATRVEDTGTLSTKGAELFADKKPELYTINLAVMKEAIGKFKEQMCSDITETFSDSKLRLILSGLNNADFHWDGEIPQETDYCLRSDLSFDIEQIQDIVADATEVETIARYIGGVDDPDRIRMVFSLYD